MEKNLLRLSVLLLAALPLSAVSAEEYEMVFSMVSETGVESEFAMPVFEGTLDSCNVSKRGQQVPRTVPKGTIVSPGNNSYEWTITAVTCRFKAGN